VTSLLILWWRWSAPWCSPSGGCDHANAQPLPRALGVLFVIGTSGVFLRRNVITLLLSIEIMLNAVNLTFVAAGRHFGQVDGQIIVFFVMTVAAAEAAVGLAIVIALFRHRETLSPDAFTSLKW
jgi:NADH-quinone oxidoreductase subunit K